MISSCQLAGAFFLEPGFIGYIKNDLEKKAGVCQNTGPALAGMPLFC